MPINEIGVVIYIQGMFAVAMLTPLWLTSDQLIPSQQAIPLIACRRYCFDFSTADVGESIDTIGADSSAMFMNACSRYCIGINMVR